MLTERMFVHTRVFDKKWADIGCCDDDLLELQKTICENPQLPPVISGTGGVRKIRIALEGHGKSGGARVLYVDFSVKGIVGLLYAYPKNEKESITAEEKKSLKAMVEQINENWSEK
ncbi:MAG: type II toxin-antitoxin system RelE/ParE family toxin [Gracilibacteraceae bacterium]|jgi:hypothetical protein|nr:type II toxin-antitoxin system RelE/ParE family toxin [Gracilibacteraceae bacterium]